MVSAKKYIKVLSHLCLHFLYILFFSPNFEFFRDLYVSSLFTLTDVHLRTLLNIFIGVISQCLEAIKGSFEGSLKWLYSCFPNQLYNAPLKITREKSLSGFLLKGFIMTINSLLGSWKNICNSMYVLLCSIFGAFFPL